MTGKHCI